MKNKKDEVRQLPIIFSEVWVSQSARKIWSRLFSKLNHSIVESVLLGIVQGKWNQKKIRLYGNSYMLFLERVQSYNLLYESHKIEWKSTSSRICYEVLVYRKEYEEIILSDNSGDSFFSTVPLSIWEIAQRSAKAKKSKIYFIEHKQTLLSALLWQDLGLSLFCGTPSVFDDNHFTKIVMEHLDWMRESGFTKEVSYLESILSWPMAWSSYHGIQEIKTPVFKLFITDVIVYGKKRTLHLIGSSYPNEGAIGIQFPYKKPKFGKVFDSKSFKKGIFEILK